MKAEALNKIEKISGWGNYPMQEALVSSPVNRVELRQYVLDNKHFIARGNGKSYGDAALGNRVLSTLALREILDFNTEDGILECEAGILLSDLLPTIIPAGWFFHVSPGIKSISIGGAIAADVHGKNHPTKGCFSNYLISFELMLSDATIITCSREQNTDLFWQTCGGMGWTGVILSARIQLMRIRSTEIRQRTIQCKNLAGIFRAFESNRAASYAVGWIDTTASGKDFGRGAVFIAEHAEANTPLVWQEKKASSIPFFAPSWLLNPLSIRVFNALYFRKNRSRETVVDLDANFFPLDGLKYWNRLYGRRGFIQYQFCLPEDRAVEGIYQLLETIAQSQETPFLSVLKRYGEGPPAAINTFPIKGYSLALDFPRTATILELVKKLDAQVWELGGKIYLAKDSCSAAKMSRVNPATFGDPKFWSALRERISS